MGIFTHFSVLFLMEICVVSIHLLLSIGYDGLNHYFSVAGSFVKFIYVLYKYNYIYKPQYIYIKLYIYKPQYINTMNY